MHDQDELLRRLKKRTADPVRFVDAAAWVRPMLKIGALAEQKDIDDAERLLGFEFPILFRRMYTEIGNGVWGPHYGFHPIPIHGGKPSANDLVGQHLECTSVEHAIRRCFGELAARTRRGALSRVCELRTLRLQ